MLKVQKMYQLMSSVSFKLRKVEDTKGVVGSHTLKDRQYSDQKTDNDWQDT